MLLLILLSQIAVSIAAPTHECDVNKIDIAAGEYRLTNGTAVGSKVRYTCPVGQYPHPSYVKECLPNGKWSSEKVKSQCKVVQCPRPALFENGKISPRKINYFVGDILHFDCWKKFQLVGPENRTCLQNGKWSEEETKCDNLEGDCPYPGIPIGATKVGTSYKITDKVKYECQQGLQMFGSRERVCQESKRWSGTEPSCRYWYTYDTPAEVAEAFSDSLSKTIKSSFRDKAKEDTTTGGLMNVFIVIDASKSVGPRKFQTAKDISEVFIKRMASFDFVPRYAVISYASFAKSIVQLSDDDSTDANAVIEKIQAFNYSEHEYKPGTNMWGALKEVYDMLVLQNVTDPNKLLQTRNVILLMTDGNHNVGGNPALMRKEIRELLDIRKDSKREDFLDFYVFGLGDDTDDEVINEFASKKNARKHVFKMKSIDDLKKAFDQILGGEKKPQICDHCEDSSRGEKEKEEMYPWIAKITITRPGSQVKCKGSIVNENFILTAAHCFHLDESLRAIFVQVGKYIFSVKNLYRHDMYTTLSKREDNSVKTFNYDLALIELRQKIEFSSNVRPIYLPCTNWTSWALKQQEESVSCSDHEKTLLSSELVKAMFIAEEQEDKYERKDVIIKQGSKRLACIEDTKKIDKFKDITFIKEVVTDNYLCTGGTEPQEDPQICEADVGGPLIVPFKQHYIQVGIINWGTINSCNGPKRHPGPVPPLSRDFHTNLFYMVDWLKEKLKNELEFVE